MTHESFLSRNKTPISFRFSSDALSNLLDMDPKTMPEDEDFVEWVAGNKVIKGSIPLSHRYGGYQFGHWVIMMEYFVKARASSLHFFRHCQTRQFCVHFIQLFNFVHFFMIFFFLLCSF